jgi:hypothetical protein
MNKPKHISDENYGEHKNHHLRNVLSALNTSSVLLENYLQQNDSRDKQIRHARIIRKCIEELKTLVG